MNARHAITPTHTCSIRHASTLHSVGCGAMRPSSASLGAGCKLSMLHCPAGTLIIAYTVHAH